MHKYLIVAAAVAFSSPVVAQTHNFVNPCQRGPIPDWNVINHQRTEFVNFLMQARPGMPQDIGTLIAHEMCDDMSLVGNSQGLTDRLNLLIRKYGY